VGFFLINIFAALLIIYSLWMFLMTTAFCVIRMDDLSFLFNSFFETTGFPITMYKGWLLLALTYVLPAAFLKPAKFVNCKSGMADRPFYHSLWLSSSFGWLARRFLKFALASYTSACSWNELLRQIRAVHNP